MIYLPALFFCICFIISILKYGWNVEAYMYMLFLLTGIASIMLDANNLYGYNCLKMDLGVVAPISYCLLLFFCIKPFGYFFRGDLIRRVDAKKEKYIDWFIYFCFALFLIISVVAFTRIEEILFNSVLSEVRQENYMGERESFYNKYTGLPRYICALSTFFYTTAYICLFLFFYNLIYRKKSWIFHVVTLLASTPQLIASILQVDRSQFLYWAILFVFSLTVFYRQLSFKTTRRIVTLATPLMIAGITYFVAVSVSRWGEGDSSGWIKYMGMNYLNYCNFVNNIWDAPVSVCELFPFTYMLLGKPGYFGFAEIVYHHTKMYIATFSTFMGLIFSISGPIIFLLYIFCYHIVSMKFLRRRNMNVVSLYGLIKMWIVALVPLLGVFGYFYMGYPATLAIVLWLILGNLTRK